jgi:hypothetical protein
MKNMKFNYFVLYLQTLVIFISVYKKYLEAIVTIVFWFGTFLNTLYAWSLEHRTSSFYILVSNMI